MLSQRQKDMSLISIILFFSVPYDVQNSSDMLTRRTIERSIFLCVHTKKKRTAFPLLMMDRTVAACKHEAHKEKGKVSHKK
jgi:hypothetical protein